MPEDEPDRSKCDGEEEMGGGERRLGACLPRVEWLFKTVVAVAGWAVTQVGPRNPMRYSPYRPYRLD